MRRKNAEFYKEIYNGGSVQLGEFSIKFYTNQREIVAIKNVQIEITYNVVEEQEAE